MKNRSISLLKQPKLVCDKKKECEIYSKRDKLSKSNKFINFSDSFPSVFFIFHLFPFSSSYIHGRVLAEQEQEQDEYFTMFGWCFGKSRISNAMSIVELLVHMDCEGCEKRVRRAISKLDGKGVDSLEIDMDKQKVTVSGYVDQRRVLKVTRRTGRKAEFWPYPYDNEYYPYAAQYLDESTFSSTYNYYTHGYNESMHGYLPDPLFSKIIDDQMAEIFSEDNVHHACSIM